MARKARRVRTETLSLRMTPKTRYLVEIMSRNQRRTITSIVEWAIELAASEKERSIADSTWSVDERERLALMKKNYPSLLTYDEEIEVREMMADGR